VVKGKIPPDSRYLLGACGVLPVWLVRINATARRSTSDKGIKDQEANRKLVIYLTMNHGRALLCLNGMSTFQMPRTDGPTSGLFPRILLIRIVLVWRSIHSSVWLVSEAGGAVGGDGGPRADRFRSQGGSQIFLALRIFSITAS
jgi:hypothetical protein